MSVEREIWTGENQRVFMNQEDDLGIEVNGVRILIPVARWHKVVLDAATTPRQYLAKRSWVPVKLWRFLFTWPLYQPFRWILTYELDHR